MSNTRQVAEEYARIAWILKQKPWLVMQIVIPADMRIATYTWKRNAQLIKAAAEQAKREWYQWIKYPTSVDGFKWVDDALDYLIFDPKDAKIISDFAQDKLWIAVWRWVMENLLKWWAVAAWVWAAWIAAQELK